MAKVFNLSIISPQNLIYSGEISSLIVPAQLGYLGVLADHAPLIANLTPGKISFRDISDKMNVIHSKGSGIIEVLNNNASILLDSTDHFA